MQRLLCTTVSLRSVYNKLKSSIDGNINFLIKDNYTILQNRRVLSKAYIELIRKIDEAVDKELKKEIFSNYLPIK